MKKVMILFALILGALQPAAAQCCRQQVQPCQTPICDTTGVCQPTNCQPTQCTQQTCTNTKQAYCQPTTQQNCAYPNHAYCQPNVRTNGQEVCDPHSLIVYYNGEKGKNALKKAVKKYGAEVMYDYQNFSGIAIRLPNNKSLADAQAYFSKVKGVTQVSRNRIVHPCHE